MAGVLLFAGLVLIASPGGTGFLLWAAWRRHRRISSTIAQLTCAQLASMDILPPWVAITGRLGETVSQAPRSGSACAWYQIEYAHSPQGDDRLERWVEFPAGAELVAVTDGSGTVFLTPELARTTLAGPSIATISARGRDGDVSWQEVTILPDVEVFVVGRPARTNDHGPIPTRVVEKGPGFLPHVGFPMSTPTRPSPDQDGVVLRAGWRSPCGATQSTAEQTRRAYALSVKRMAGLVVALPALGLALIALSAAIQS